MPSEIIPTAQETFLDPYRGRLFDFNPADLRHYIVSYVDNVLRVLGNNCMITGCDILAASIDINNSVNITISPGICIVDTTCIEFTEISYLQLDVTPYDSTGYLIVSVGYKNYQSLEFNDPYLKLSYVSLDGNHVAPLPWRVDMDHLLLGYFTFTKSPFFQIINKTPTIGATVTLNIIGNPYNVAYKDNLTNKIISNLINNMDIIEMTQDFIDQGYFTTTNISENFNNIEITMVNGPVLVNKSTLVSVNTHITTEVPDYDVYRGKIFIRNGIYGSYTVTGISEQITVGDILRIEYTF